MTGNYSTEYGKTSGGVVNAITRSGANAIHGSAYEFVRNSALDANNFFDNAFGRKRPSFRRNQFGASIGGPIIKEKVFYFGDYEGIRQAKGTTTVVTVPSPAMEGINVTGGVPNVTGIKCSKPDTLPACSPTPVTIDPTGQVQKFFPAWPAPNAGLKAGSNGDIGLYAFDSLV